MQPKATLIILLFFSGFGNEIWAQGSKVSLFNGKNLAGWHWDVPALDSNKTERIPFMVRAGKLVSLGTPGGHLITDKKYKNFRLSFRYRFTDKPGNCGILVFVSTPRSLYRMFPRSIEIQMMHENAGDFWCIQEDITVPDMENRRGPRNTWGVSEGKARRIPNLTEGTEKPLGEWNNYQIECYQNSIKVWLNGVLVNYGFNATASDGQIALQSEGAEVEFENISLEYIQRLSE
ncbi:3-keto-disaccharide hydrolase [Dyadobacter tibetensis]|uniref:3-keto-disaccharide hydrolase n=1 Tax=Dyadobacter tibetensis TaxID=1211851 RepID=UPI00047152C0|nr:DUF1080 domain-containing protein [Dyadobacter tibetensis]